MPNFTLHLFLSSIESETRLFKEAAFTLGSGICDRVAVLGLWREGLALGETTEYGLEIRRIPTMLRRYQNNPLLRCFGSLRKAIALWSLIQYCLSAIQASRQLRPDHISCHNASILPLAWVAARLSGATLEYLPHELETERTGLTGLRKRLTALIERHFIRSARNVVVVCDPIRDWYQKTYGLKNVHVIRNVPERNSVRIRPIPGGGFREIFAIPQGARIFIYQGLFSAGRGIKAMLDCFAAQDSRRSHIVLMGYGEAGYQKMIEEAARRHANIHFHPAVAREWIVSYSASADVGILVTERPSLSYRYSLPNKFFEWAHAGLPVIVSDELEYQGQIIKENGLGWVMPLEDLHVLIGSLGKDAIDQSSNAIRKFSNTVVWENEAQVFKTIYSQKRRRHDPDCRNYRLA